MSLVCILSTVINNVALLSTAATVFASPTLPTSCIELLLMHSRFFFFFFQAEDGIRDWSVTGVQTCALPISGGITFVQDPTSAKYDGMPRSALDSGWADFCLGPEAMADALLQIARHSYLSKEIGRASCRERV